MSAPVITAPYLAAVAMLGLAGAAKLVRPETTVRALQQASLPATRGSVRIGAAAEGCVAVAALARPGTLTGALVAASYAAFTIFVAIALRMDWPLSSCGCFGKPDAIPTKAHAVLNAGAVVCSVWWAVSGPSSLANVFSSQPWDGAPLGLLAAVLALLAYVVWTNTIPASARGMAS